MIGGVSKLREADYPQERERLALDFAKEDLRAPDWKVGGFFFILLRETLVLPHWPSVIWVGRVAYSWVSIYGLEWSSYGRSHSVFR